ncbi:ATP-binding protein [Formosa sp. L2A11]|uniref:tetratricopeptide repeat-containing sensor histidine kinase n=1 Tax=Formosa sp. L2A11 TaxID=2686363 RepID=UPI00131DDF60|nr:ATP-binding protein [Formosa sp. L2A11]
MFHFQTIYSFQNKEKDSLVYYNKLISNPNNNSSLTKAYLYFDKMKAKSIIEKDTFYAIYYSQKISVIQYYIGDYYGCENSIVEALRLLVNSNSKRAIANKISLYNRLGKIYDQLLDYNSALRFYNKSLELATSQKQINIIQNNKALIFIDQHKFESAEFEFSKIYNESKNLDDTLETYKALDNLGFVQSKLNKPEGLDNMITALNLKIASNYHMSIYASYAHLSEYYKDKNDIKKSYFYAQKGYDIAKQINSPSFLKEALRNLISIAPNPNVVAYLKLTDNLNTIKQLQENKYAKVKYDYTEKDNIAKETLLKKEREKRWKLTYLSLGIFIALVSVFVIVFQKYKYRKERMFQIYNTETRISKKIHDEVANDVHRVLNELQVQPRVTDEILDELEGIYERTRDISKENNTLDVNFNFEELLNDLLLGYKSNQVNIIKNSDSKIDWNKVKRYKKVGLYRVIQELLVNMKKHSQASIVVLKFSKINKKIEIFYSDNGSGSELIKGSGIQNVENRIKNINGTITFETGAGKGFKAKIII